MRHWRRISFLNLFLLPLAGIFLLAVLVRRKLYGLGWLRSVRVGVPVVIVGNITAGGTGKTPLIIALVQALHHRGYRPGVVSRGYGGASPGPMMVDPEDSATVVGDEPLLIAWKTDMPVAIGRNRVAAARLLLARNPGVDVILADDGLQHYALSRDIELAVVDGDCCLGNGWMQPAGPLREPRSRLQSVDALVMTRRAGRPSRCDLRHHRLVSVNHAPGQLYRLLDPQDKRPLVNGIHEGVHAVAGIAHPENFFKVLEDAGLHIERHAFPDHHEFCQADFPQQGTVIMTEKDAIKCKTYAKADWWVLEWHADPGDELVSWLAKAMASPGKG